MAARHAAHGGFIAAKKDFDPSAFVKAAGIIKNFIEGYHERLEEDRLFPRFEKAGKLIDLVAVLRQQHAAGRKVTDGLISLAKSDPRSEQVRAGISTFVRMYRPHEAREDTILFPALRGIVSRNEFDALGEEFEKEEHRLFGKEGFEGIVVQVGDIEKTLGVYDLAQFTPR